jgi:feruloyl-CoA synthase
VLPAEEDSDSVIPSAQVAPNSAAGPRVLVESRGDGSLVLRHPEALAPLPASAATWLSAAAARAPERTFLAERGRDGSWEALTYRTAVRRVSGYAEGLLECGATDERPLLILSENSVDHALLTLAAYLAGIPVVPVSPAYTLASQDLGLLRWIVLTVRPGVVFAGDGDRYAAGLGVATDLGAVAIVGRNAGPSAITIDQLERSPSPRLQRAASGVTHDTPAKLLFTSGSTGRPKGVVVTHRMLLANQEAIAQVWPFLAEAAPVVVDWLPWSHAFGGNHNLGLVLRNAGSLYIDDGRPVPDLFGRSIEALAEVQPNIVFNVPKGLALLADVLDADAKFAARFFERLRMIFYAGADLPASTWTRLRASARAADREVFFTTSWGATETTSTATSLFYPAQSAGNIGLPVPGVEVKLAPVEDKLELRVRGPTVTPGYVPADEGPDAFDEEGYYRTGDAAEFVDTTDVGQGIRFGGRLAENFKLSSGTWVNAGHVRIALVAACAPAIEDAAICGHDRSEIGALAYPNLLACRALCGAADDVPAADLVSRPEVIACVAEGLSRLAKTHGHSSRVERLMLLTEAPALDQGEITDKGYLNQRRILSNRAEQVETLFAQPMAPGIITVAAGSGAMA